MRKHRNSVVEPISELNKIQIRDTGEPLVELNGFDDRIVVLPNWRTHEPQRLFARKTVAQMLQKAARLLPKGYKLGVFSAYRSIEEPKANLSQSLSAHEAPLPQRAQERLEALNE